ncbi:MAG TPA: PHP domain-containing protein [Bryobacteraceae bacterium]|nr:PHP domain-containing protein [Bryobacteraceae bacterium]
MIDLHSHTTASDGTFSPAELIEAAATAGLDALAITDHDTFAGYQAAQQFAEQRGVRLLCGIELSTKANTGRRQTVHLLGYFLRQPPAQQFCDWLIRMQESRRDRNCRLAERLQSMGFDIRIEEVEALGRSMAGRPHFARLMVSKGYAPNYRAAFDLYLDESAPGYVDREEPSLEEGIRRIAEAGGLSSIAHPIRLGLPPDAEESLISGCTAHGLSALEAYHSDQGAEDTQRYLAVAERYGLRVTGGSDFHGDNKPGVRLGTGPGRLHVPVSVLEALLA